jgi:hypothetical protein
VEQEHGCKMKYHLCHLRGSFLPFSSFLLLHLLEHGVVALVVPELALVQVDDVSAHVVQETLVVGHCTMNSNKYV